MHQDSLDYMEEGAKKVMLEIRANCMPQVDALLAAGWRFELPEIVNRKAGETLMATEPWQWYWRRPPRRKGSKGMKFWSTSMAFNALRREIAKQSKGDDVQVTCPDCGQTIEHPFSPFHHNCPGRSV